MGHAGCKPTPLRAVFHCLAKLFAGKSESLTGFGEFTLPDETGAGITAAALSIAVFGSPGSGKSFGVTQIAKTYILRRALLLRSLCERALKIKKGEAVPISPNILWAMLLAQNEHIRWMKERTAAGWVYGPVRDNEKKIHPLLVDWGQLPDKEKQKDIDAVNNIIPLLAGVGLRVYRTV